MPFDLKMERLPANKDSKNQLRIRFAIGDKAYVTDINPADYCEPRDTADRIKQRINDKCHEWYKKLEAHTEFPDRVKTAFTFVVNRQAIMIEVKALTELSVFWTYTLLNDGREFSDEVHYHSIGWPRLVDFLGVNGLSADGKRDLQQWTEENIQRRENPLLNPNQAVINEFLNSLQPVDLAEIQQEKMVQAMIERVVFPTGLR